MIRNNIPRDIILGDDDGYGLNEKYYIEPMDATMWNVYSGGRDLWTPSRYGKKCAR